jgi:two-component system nitrogen regulation sensor histidine kinase NtrY
LMRRRARWILLAALLLGGAWSVYRLLDRSTEVGQSGEPWGLVPLSLALIVLTLALAGVLIRNLVVVVVERKRGILGSNLRMKLVFLNLGLVLLPAIVLFSGSAKVIKETVEAILRNPLEQQARADEIVGSWRDYFQGSALDRARELAAELRDAPSDGAEEVTQRLRTFAAEEGLALVQLSAPHMEALTDGHAAGSDSGDALVARLLELATEVREGGNPRASDFDRLNGGLVVLAAAPVGGGRVAAVALELPDAIAAAVEEMHLRAGDYQRFKHQRRQLVRFYVTLIALMFIATLFVATWIGLYVARRITEPIREVAAAAREISVGNLNVRVRTAVGDEMGLLVDAFNEMAAELEENREVITRSTAELRRSNKALD